MRSSSAFLQSVPEECCGVRDLEEPLDGDGCRESLLARSRACLIRSSQALRKSSPEERCGVRDRDELFGCGARRESLPARSRYCLMRSSNAFCNSSLERRWGPRARDELRESESLDCAPRSLLPRPRSWASLEITAIPVANKTMLSLLSIFILRFVVQFSTEGNLRLTLLNVPA